MARIAVVLLVGWLVGACACPAPAPREPRYEAPTRRPWHPDPPPDSLRRAP